MDEIFDLIYSETDPLLLDSLVAWLINQPSITSFLNSCILSKNTSESRYGLERLMFLILNLNLFKAFNQ